MRTRNWPLRLVGTLLLAAMIWPLGYAAWVSFSPGELLAAPMGAWSLHWYRDFLDSPRWKSALANSLAVAALAVAGSLLGGTGLALAVARYHFRGRRLLSGAVLLPLFVPGVVLGMGLLPLVYVLGIWGTRLSLALAHSLGSLPVVFLIVRSALDEVSPELELAARGLGATAWRAFWRVTVPLIRPSVLAGAAMSFILSVNEITLAMFLATPEIETLPHVIWTNLRYNLTPIVAAASCITLAVTLLGLAAVAVARPLVRVVRRLRPGAREVRPLRTTLLPPARPAARSRFDRSHKRLSAFRLVGYNGRRTRAIARGDLAMPPNEECPNCHRKVEDWHVEWYKTEGPSLFQGLAALDCP